MRDDADKPREQAQGSPAQTRKQMCHRPVVGRTAVGSGACGATWYGGRTCSGSVRLSRREGGAEPYPVALLLQKDACLLAKYYHISVFFSLLLQAKNKGAKDFHSRMQICKIQQPHIRKNFCIFILKKR